MSGSRHQHRGAIPAYRVSAGCFNRNGGSISGAFHFNPQVAPMGEFGGAYANSIVDATLSPTLTSYLFGPLYSFVRQHSRLIPFGQVFVASGPYPGRTPSDQLRPHQLRDGHR
jgi:hypothetical protein